MVMMFLMMLILLVLMIVSFMVFFYLASRGRMSLILTRQRTLIVR